MYYKLCFKFTKFTWTQLQVFDRADFANTIRPGPMMYTGHGGTYAPQSGDRSRAGPPGMDPSTKCFGLLIMCFTVACACI